VTHRQLNLDSSAREFIDDMKSAKTCSDEEIEEIRSKIYDLLEPLGIKRPKPLSQAEHFLSSLQDDRQPERKRRKEPDSRRGSSMRDDYDTETEELKRQERLKNDQTKAFFDRLRRWEAHEVARDRKILRDARRDEEDARNRVRMAEFLAKYDDDKELERDDFYRDRHAWFQRRQHFLKQETEYDERDRQLEGTDEPQIEKEEAVQPAEDTANVVGRIMTKEERETRIKQLIARIPVEKEELFAWPVKWELVEEVFQLISRQLIQTHVQSMLEKTLGPFINKKIVEYLGEEEATLLAFVTGLVRQQKEPHFIQSELQEVLLLALVIHCLLQDAG
jgi:hypothetical protein